MSDIRDFTFNETFALENNLNRREELRRKLLQWVERKELIFEIGQLTFDKRV